MFLETNEIARVTQQLERLPGERLNVETVLLDDQSPTTMMVEAAEEANVLDHFFPILLQRAKRLSPLLGVLAGEVLKDISFSLNPCHER